MDKVQLLKEHSSILRFATAITRTISVYQYHQGNINSFPFILNVLKFIQDIQFRNSDAWKNLHFVKTNIRDQ